MFSYGRKRNECLSLIARESANWILSALLFVISKIIDVCVPPFQRKFSLSDTTISFPHGPDTITDPWLWAISLLFPVLVILAVGFKRRNVRETHDAILGMLSSTAITYFVCQITKNLVGRHRPDFLDRCQPSLNSNGSPTITPELGLSDNSICTQTDTSLLRNGSQSFFSGHTSTAFAGLGFLSLYLSYIFVLWRRPGQVYKTWIALFPLIVALYIGLSRISDYRHHWQDVFIGLIFGELVAIYSFFQFFSASPRMPIVPPIILKHPNELNYVSEPINS